MSLVIVTNIFSPLPISASGSEYPANFIVSGYSWNVNKIICTLSINPGSSGTCSKTVSSATTWSLTSGKGKVDAGKINVTLKVSKTATVTISTSITTKCPLKHNNKNVKRCTVVYYPHSTHYKFTIRKVGIGDIGKGTTLVLTGIYEKITYTYQ